MQLYKNLGGDSNVRAFEIDGDSITVEFMSGANRFYLYNNSAPGPHHVANLKSLAIAGQGLNSYIGKNLRSAASYVRKW